MATVTVDGHSISLNGKRLWLVSGTVHYARIPRDLWRARLLAAKNAGLNTIETPIVWAAHEPHEGHFDFSKDLDLKHFLTLVAELDLHAIIRVGPFVGDGYDLGGLPPWLIPAVDRQVRTANPRFLQAFSTFIAKAASQFADLQVTKRKKGIDGPVVLVQAEHEWFCAHDQTAGAYLNELARFLRENNVNVPIINQNNLYQPVEGEIDTWSGFSSLHAIVRQLRTINPDHPPLIASLKVGAPDVWGLPRQSRKSPQMVASALTQVLAAGGQFNVSPFDGGAAPAFSGARLASDSSLFLTTNRDDAGPISHTGAPNPIHDAVRRVATFASSFESVLTGLNIDTLPIAIAPDDVAPTIVNETTGETQPRNGGPNLAVIHAPGSRGHIAFIFADPEDKKLKDANVIFPDGTSIPVEIPDHAVAWVLRDVHLVARATLDYSNLSAFTLAGRILVCFGPAGARGMLSINKAPFEITVPSGAKPAVETHEDVVVVVCNTKQIDATIVHDGAVLVGAAGVTPDDQPIPHHDFKSITTITQDGETSTTTGAKPKAPSRPAISKWLTAPEDDNATGDNVRYARIPGPDSMEALGAPSGYAWIRIKLKNSSTKKARAALFQAADRIHLYNEGALLDVLGNAPGADPNPTFTLPLAKGTQTLAALVDNLGRYDAGNALGQPKGIHGHIYEAKAIRTTKPKLVDADLIDPLTFRAPIFGLRYGDVTDAPRLTWTIKHLKKSPILMAVDPAKPVHDLVLVMLNDEPVEIISPGQNARLVFDSETLKRGNNVFQLAVVGDMSDNAQNLGAAVSFFEGASNITEKAEWAFAKWEPPPASAYEEVARAALAGRPGAALKGRPRWWKAIFTPADTDRPLLFDATGLSKGQLFLNGTNLCRFFVATRTNKAVPPQTLYHLPRPLLEPDADNELLIFDEHGFPPAKTKLRYE